MGNLCLENRIFFKLPEKMDFGGNLPGKIDFFFTRIQDPQISNHTPGRLKKSQSERPHHACIQSPNNSTGFPSAPISRSKSLSSCIISTLRPLHHIGVNSGV